MSYGPTLDKHWKELEEMPRNHPEVVEFKDLIGNCKAGNFNTPDVNALKRKIFIKEHGTDSELGSWKQVLERHGPAVAYAALRQGNLPYIPHTLLNEGHGVPWPDSHEFLMTRKWWKESWRTEITFGVQSEADAAKTERGIQEWLKREGEPCTGSSTWEELHGTLKRGIPSG